MIFVFLFLTYITSLCIIGSRFIHLIRTDSNVFLLWLSNIPLYICAIAAAAFLGGTLYFLIEG